MRGAGSYVRTGALLALLALGCASRPASPDSAGPRLLSAEDTRALARAYRDALESFDVLEANHPSFLIPTTGALSDDTLHVIADSQVRSFDRDGRIWPLERLRPVEVLRIRLRR